MKAIKNYEHPTLDKLTYVFGILLPIFTVPQAYNVLVNKETAGVSLLTWTFYLFASLLFAVFGIIHKERLLIVTYLPFTIIEAAIVFGLLIN